MPHMRRHWSCVTCQWKARVIRVCLLCWCSALWKRSALARYIATNLHRSEQERFLGFGETLIKNVKHTWSFASAHTKNVVRCFGWPGRQPVMNCQWYPVVTGSAVRVRSWTAFLQKKKIKKVRKYSARFCAFPQRIDHFPCSFVCFFSSVSTCHWLLTTVAVPVRASCNMLYRCRSLDLLSVFL